MPSPDEQRVDRSPPAEQLAERRRTRARSRRPARSRSQYPSGTSGAARRRRWRRRSRARAGRPIATRLRATVRRAKPVPQRGRDREGDRDGHEGGGGLADGRVTELRAAIGAHEPVDAIRVLPRPARWNRAGRPSIASGRSMPTRSRSVGPRSTICRNPERRVVADSISPGAIPARGSPRRVSVRVRLVWYGETTMTASWARSTFVEEPTDHCVAAPERRLVEHRALVRGREAGGRRRRGRGRTPRRAPPGAGW